MKRREFIKLLSGAAGLTVSPCARAQLTAMPVIGYVHVGSPAAAAPNLAAFRRALNDAGYVEGQSVVIEYRFAEGQFDRLPALMAELVGRKVNVIVAAGGSSVAAKAATSTIPIVGMAGGDPVAGGLVASLSRPGGNLTGIALFTNILGPKRLELLREAVPNPKLIALLSNPSQLDPAVKLDLAEVEGAARRIGQQTFVANADNDSELESAFATISGRGADALLILASPFFPTGARRLRHWQRAMPSLRFMNRVMP